MNIFDIPPIAMHYHLRKYQISQFEANYNLWKKLRNMDEYEYHDHFRLFVRILESKLWSESYE